MHLYVKLLILFNDILDKSFHPTYWAWNYRCWINPCLAKVVTEVFFLFMLRVNGDLNYKMLERLLYQPWKVSYVHTGDRKLSIIVPAKVQVPSSYRSSADAVLTIKASMPSSNYLLLISAIKNSNMCLIRKHFRLTDIISECKAHRVLTNFTIPFWFYFR